MLFRLLHRVSKNCAFLFLSELRQISTNFNKFCYVDGKLAQIVRYMYIVHLPWPTSLQYLVKCRCSIFLPNTALLQSDCSDLVSKWRRLTVVTIFLLRGHCQTCTGCPETIFYVWTWWRSGASSTQHRRFPGAREMRETRRRLGACVRVRGAHFEHKFWHFEPICHDN